MVRRAVLILAFFSGFWSLNASPLSIDADFTMADLTPYLQILESPDDSVTFESVQNGTAPEFTDTHGRTPAFGFTESSYWVKFSLLSSEPGLYILELDDPLIDYLEFYYPKNGEYQRTAAGDSVPHSKRQLREPKPVFRIILEPGIPQTFYIYIKGGYVNIPLNLYTMHSYKGRSDETNVFFGITYGVIIALSLYNFVLFLGMRDLNYLIYSLYHFASVLLHSIFNGLASRYLWPESPFLANYSLIITATLMMILSISFVSTFLDLKKTQPLLYRITYYTGWFIAGTLPLLLISDMSFAARMSSYMALALILLFVVTVIRALLNRQREAFFMSAGWSLLMSGTFVYIAKGFGFVPLNFITNYFMQIGSVAEAVLMAAAVADKLYQLRREKENAITSALLSEQKFSAELEEKVRLRTEELRSINHHLTDTVKVRDTLFSVIAHDLRGPLSVLAVLTGEINAGRLSVSDELLREFHKTSQGMYETLEDLLYWAYYRDKNESYAALRTVTSLNSVIINCINQVSLAAHSRNIRIVFEQEKEKDTPVKVNRVAAAIIIRNLLLNAVKFTGSDGIITLKISPQNTGLVRISVTDTGPGMEPEKADMLFTGQKAADTHNNQAVISGIGLQLCREFIQAEGTSIGVISTPGKGSEFWFTLEAATSSEPDSQSGPLLPEASSDQ